MWWSSGPNATKTMTHLGLFLWKFPWGHSHLSVLRGRCVICRCYEPNQSSCWGLKVVVSVVLFWFCSLHAWDLWYDPKGQGHVPFRQLQESHSRWSSSFCTGKNTSSLWSRRNKAGTALSLLGPIFSVLSSLNFDAGWTCLAQVYSSSTNITQQYSLQVCFSYLNGHHECQTVQSPPSGAALLIGYLCHEVSIIILGPHMRHQYLTHCVVAKRQVLLFQCWL